MTSPDFVYVVSQWGALSQTFVRREAEAVHARGVPVRVVSLKPPVQCSSPLPVEHLRPLQVVGRAARAWRTSIPTLARVLRGCRPRNAPKNAVAALVGVAHGAGTGPEVHAQAQFGWVAATAAWAFARAGGGTFSVSLHAFEIHERSKVDRFTPVPLRAAAAVFVESEQDARIVGERNGIEPIVTRLGIPGSWFVAEVGERQDDLVVSVGRLVPKKGHHVLVDAVRHSEHPWRLTIVGDGDERTRLEGLVRDWGLGDRVTLAGALGEDDVRALLRSAAVFGLASVELAGGDRDGTPMAIVEAMASGAAVVATDAGAISELLGDTGLVVGQDDPAGFAAALDRLWDPGTRLTLATSALARAHEWDVARTAATVVEAVAAARASTQPSSATAATR